MANVALQFHIHNFMRTEHRSGSAKHYTYTDTFSWQMSMTIVIAIKYQIRLCTAETIIFSGPRFCDLLTALPVHRSDGFTIQRSINVSYSKACYYVRRIYKTRSVSGNFLLCTGIIMTSKVKCVIFIVIYWPVNPSENKTGLTCFFHV